MATRHHASLNTLESKAFVWGFIWGRKKGVISPKNVQNVKTDNNWIAITLRCIIPSVQFSSVAQSCPTLCNPMNHNTPGLLSITNYYSLGLLKRLVYFCICLCVCVYVCVQSCLTLYSPMDCSPPVSSIHGIFQERILEWVSMPDSGDILTRGSNLHLLNLLFGRWILYH